MTARLTVGQFVRTLSEWIYFLRPLGLSMDVPHQNLQCVTLTFLPELKKGTHPATQHPSHRETERMAHQTRADRDTACLPVSQLAISPHTRQGQREVLYQLL